MRHTRAGNDDTIARTQAPPADSRDAAPVAAIVTAVGRIVADGGRVTRTGAMSLFKQKDKAPELVGVSRRQMEDAIDAAIELGQLKNGTNGLVAT